MTIKRIHAERMLDSHCREWLRRRIEAAITSLEAERTDGAMRPTSWNHGSAFVLGWLTGDAGLDWLDVERRIAGRKDGDA